jgi:hypothetical protein
MASRLRFLFSYHGSAALSSPGTYVINTRCCGYLVFLSISGISHSTPLQKTLLAHFLVGASIRTGVLSNPGGQIWSKVGVSGASQPPSPKAHLL